MCLRFTACAATRWTRSTFACVRGRGCGRTASLGPHADAPAPPLLQASQLVKLARDCQIVGSAISEAEPPLLEADINVAFTAEVTRAEKVAPGHGDGALMRAKMAPVRPIGPVVSCDRKKVRRAGGARVGRASARSSPSPLRAAPAHTPTPSRAR